VSREPASNASRSRRRGRPRSGESRDTRDAIVSAARAQFAESGFQGASVRSIAAAAGVDAGLIRHYFGDKAGLLVATMQLPVNPIELITPLFEQGPVDLGPKIVRTFLGAWDPHRDVFAGLMRTTIATADQEPPALNLLRSVILAGLRSCVTGPDRDLRATLVMSELVGMAVLRYVVALEPLASTPASQVVDTYGPVLQALITPGRPPSSSIPA
jgi:AcrR family transcriptional regulator